ncbi:MULTISPECIES: DeoR/GlpR family DNA-binding transcription regulator [Rhizobium]|uniref:DeoR family transcriptional regulator n=2 Tax=Rhizobium TaxID=379 RepID=A0A109JHW5_9HYPH|nr:MULTISPECIES: DeoR/GlpR family DNA-binding transcription regulator [Rhizobium]KWV49043.1 DeoR family transcriptional regulator [Rhizobium altiplani]KWV49153.1 DeoR family transcriptional regulator [Rhizobium altiplani]KWV58854.1 DeoR family transcriptional regulator [Rhizobium altiplani]CCM80152.1 Transcriptional regulator, DeoR family [Rhizobium mesoamericanum STM3625]
MTNGAERRRQMVERAQKTGYVPSKIIEDEFGVDSSTIRRDLARLEAEGLIIRTQGGFLPIETKEGFDYPYEPRRKFRSSVKGQLGQYAAGLVKDGQTVLVDSGSTTWHVANSLKSRQNLTVITNDLQIAMLLSECSNINLHVTGGVQVDTVYTLVGPNTVDYISKIHVDIAFIGAEAVEAELGLSNVNVIEVPVKQAMIRAADCAVLVADSSKLGKRSLARVCGIDELSQIITDSRIDAEQRKAFGKKLQIVEL